MGLREGSPVAPRPWEWEPGTSTHVSEAHDVGASWAPGNDGIILPLHYALLSLGRLCDRVVGVYGG